MLRLLVPVNAKSPFQFWTLLLSAIPAAVALIAPPVMVSVLVPSAEALLIVGGLAETGA
jgi:hypothetical protein